MSGLGFANILLEHIDEVQRLTHVAIAAHIEASDYMGWRTQAEQDASPNSGTMRMTDEELPSIHLDVIRAQLRMVAPELVEDLMVRLRRQRKERR